MIEVPLLLLAGVAAGLVGSTAGLASLVSYPALLLAGLPPLAANVTNTVALLGVTAGTAAGSRPELTGQGARMRRLVPVAAAGGALGCVLLLALPSTTFEGVVPFLVAGAALLLLVQPRVQQLRRGGGRPATRSSWRPCSSSASTAATSGPPPASSCWR